MSMKTKQKGSSLIEILITLVILSIGILGILALQTASLKSNQSAFLRSQAALLAIDIAERMRANQQAVLAGGYDNPTATITATCLTQVSCTSTQMASHDIAEWKLLAAQQLPSGTATVCLDSTPEDGAYNAPACDSVGSIYAVKTWWDDNRDGTANQRVVMSFQP